MKIYSSKKGRERRRKQKDKEAMAFLGLYQFITYLNLGGEIRGVSLENRSAAAEQRQNRNSPSPISVLTLLPDSLPVLQTSHSHVPCSQALWVATPEGYVTHQCLHLHSNAIPWLPPGKVSQNPAKPRQALSKEAMDLHFSATREHNWWALVANLLLKTLQNLLASSPHLSSPKQAACKRCILKGVSRKG